MLAFRQSLIAFLPSIKEGNSLTPESRKSLECFLTDSRN